MKDFARVAVASALCLGANATRADTASPWVDLRDARARLIAASEGLDVEGRAMLGLQIRLAPGWKTYWREPGEAGFPPRLDWSAAENVAAADLLFPAPHRFQAYGFTSLGYAGEVVLPIRLVAADPGRLLRAHVVANFAICDEICVPARADLALDLPPGAGAPSEHAAFLAGYLARVPVGPSESALRINAVAIDGDGLRVEASADRPFVTPDLFVESGGRVGFGPPQLTLSGDGRRAVLHLPVNGDLGGLAIRLTLVDGDRALDQALTLP